MAGSYNYDVALSFAGEERDYVQAVATHLKSSRIKVFYDKFETVELWGEDLYTHLDDIYRNKARFCVMFISKNYQRKSWTNHERQSAQARAFMEKRKKYILPARFDNTEIPGIHSTTKYISLRDYTPQQFAQLIIQKLKIARSTALKLHKSSSKSVVSDRWKPSQSTLSKRIKALDKSKDPKLKTKTVVLTLEGISQLPNNKPIVYKILTGGGRNNYTGIAKRGKVHATLENHLQTGKSYIPGAKVYVEQMDNIDKAQQKADRILRRIRPKYNNLVE